MRHSSVARAFAAQGTSRLCAAVVAAMALCGCHHDKRSQPQTYTVGGQITGLNGTVTLRDNGGNDLTSSTGGQFTFTPALASGTAYSVSIASQPAGQTCTVANGAGTIGSADVTNVQVSCTTNTYTLGGSITGLTASGLVLANGSDSVSPAANVVSFTFPKPLQSGTAYAVSVQTQPAGQLCTVTAGSGTMGTANVSGVQVSCAPHAAAAPQWTWLGGSDVADQSGIYGVQGTAAAGNIPGARSASATWLDAAGNLWLFGGASSNTTGAGSQYSDLWKYDVKSGQWAWMSGSNLNDSSGNYHTKGTADLANAPGARQSAVSWVDHAGNLWLFGGLGRDANRNLGMLSDLWKFDISTSQWSWMSGPSSVNATGVYGIQGQPGANNVPGARAGAAAWVGSSGELWLFGGEGYNSGTSGYLNDVWKYDPNTGQWTWMNGPDAVNQSGIYGPKGVAGAGGTPGARWNMQASADSSGTLWVYGGEGFDATAQFNNLADLWTYNPANGQWTWMGGSKVVDTGTVYGTLGTADPNNTPGSRHGAASWIDASGGFWLSGGEGYDTRMSQSVTLGDLWRFDPQSDQWTWMAGPNTSEGAGVYGTQGVANLSNTPGARVDAQSWLDGSGIVWIFGGDGFDSEDVNGRLNDLWTLGH